jgi:hypothetical protein
MVPRRLDIHELVNADEIARGLSPFDPEGPAIAHCGTNIENPTCGT